MSTTTASRKLRVENINLRVNRDQKALIDRAASALGRNPSDFMLEAACKEAESVLLDRRYFVLSEALALLRHVLPPHRMRSHQRRIRTQSRCSPSSATGATCAVRK